MSQGWLLDTNILSDLVRNPAGRAAQHIRRQGEANIRTSIIVAAELRFGAVKKGSERLTRQLDAILAAIEILPLRRRPTIATAKSARNWKTPERPSAAMI